MPVDFSRRAEANDKFLREMLLSKVLGNRGQNYVRAISLSKNMRFFRAF